MTDAENFDNYLIVKFALAGGSARLMFMITVEREKKFLNTKALEGLHTDTIMRDLLFGKLGALHADNLSRLSQDFVDEKCTYIRSNMKRGFLSQFVLTRCESALSAAKAQELFVYCKELT